MHTKWNMTFFLFLGLVSSFMLLYSVSLQDINTNKRPYGALLAALCATAAFMVILSGLNDPTKIFNILSNPKKGFSSAVIMQVVTTFTGVLIFVKLRGRNTVITVFALLICLLSAYSLSKVYMISTRPALNTFALSTMFALLILQATATAMIKNSADGKSAKAALALNIIYGISILVFTVRLGLLTHSDRVLVFSNVTGGSIAPLFWGAVVLTFIVPLVYLITAYRKGRAATALIPSAAIIAGIFLLSMLINQMPIVERGINNRVFF